MKILVTGGTGRIGSQVIMELAKRGASVRALVRKQEASTALPKGVEVFLGDLLDPITVRKALEGIDKLYLLNAAVADELTQGRCAVKSKPMTMPKPKTAMEYFSCMPTPATTPNQNQQWWAFSVPARLTARMAK